MIIKTAIATFITASLAGGVVYYGTQGETGTNRGYGNEVAINLHPEEPGDSVSNPIVDSDEKPTTKRVVQENSSERVIDKLLKRNAEQNAAVSHPDTTNAPDDEAGVDYAEPIVEENDVDRTNDHVADYVPTHENEPGYLDSNTREVDNSTSVSPSDTGTATMLDIIFAQTEAIDKVELKDQAYLDIVSYASAQGMYPSADKAMKSIDQVELRDTARSQIAISLAKRGFVDGAFDIIDNVETDELRDIMRLQVIEAIILPERLPKVYQQY